MSEEVLDKNLTKIEGPWKGDNIITDLGLLCKRIDLERL